MSEPASIPLTDFQAHPQDALDRSQAGPVKLTERNRPYAVVVSAAWFAEAERALAGLHGGRRVLVADRLAAADRTFIEVNGPSEDEIRSDQWRD